MWRSHENSLVIGLLGFLIGCSTEANQAERGATSQAVELPSQFWEQWGDGQAELNGYELVQPRYGEERRGVAVLVFVTETFTDADRVKSDGGHDDEYPVMKLNDMRDFQTGIYDYHAMTSSFVSLGAPGVLHQPVKVSFRCKSGADMSTRSG